MMVDDLRHFLDLPEGAPGLARRLAAQLGDIVRAGTAGDVGTTWPPPSRAGAGPVTVPAGVA